MILLNQGIFAEDYKVLYDELNTRVAGYEANMDKFNEFLSILESEEDIKLEPKKDIQGEIKTSKPSDRDYDPWNIARNTQRINNLRGK